MGEERMRKVMVWEVDEDVKWGVMGFEVIGVLDGGSGDERRGVGGEGVLDDVDERVRSRRKVNDIGVVSEVL